MALAQHYSRFRVTERLLLTGHSHQAWPDVAFVAQQQAYFDAAEHLDHKWILAEAQAERVRRGWRYLLADDEGDIALGQNTHELVTRVLSAVLHPRLSLVTTDGEFHTIRRQVDRLAEAGIEVIKVAAQPVATLAERLAMATTDRTAAVLVSSVLFETAEIVPNLAIVAARAAHVGAACLIDAYHHLNVVPFNIGAMGLHTAFIVGGGYKYCQLGEGNCFLRVPPGCQLRPVLTGWFSEFEAVEDTGRRDAVSYGTGAARFAGATYDPVSHYRAAAVFDFHQAMALSPPALREINQHQVGLLIAAVQALDCDPDLLHLDPIPPAVRAGFLSVRTPHASTIVRLLAAREVWADARGQRLRLGPAPYIADAPLAEVAAVLENVLACL